MVYQSKATSQYFYPSLLDNSLLDDEFEHEVPTKTSIWILPPLEIKTTRADLEDRRRQCKRALGQQRLREEQTKHDFERRYQKDSKVIDNDDLVPAEMMGWLDFRIDNNFSGHDMEENDKDNFRFEDNSLEDYHEIFIQKSDAFDESEKISELYGEFIPLDMDTFSDDEDKENQSPPRRQRD